MEFCILSFVLLWTVPAEARYRDVFGDVNVASVIRDVEGGKELKDPAKTTMGCVENGLDYYGNDLKSMENVTTAEACAQFCSEEPKCFAWTWTKNIRVRRGYFTQLCNLKTASYGEKELYNGYKISGRKNCVSPPCEDRYKFCSKVAIMKEGKFIRCPRFAPMSVMCKKTCRFCTAPVESKRDVFGDANVASVIRDVEGGKELKDPAKSTMGCVEDKVQFLSNTLKSKEEVPSAEACAQFCAEEADCFAWTWTKNIKRPFNTPRLCVLKTADYARLAWYGKEQISGRKNCVSLPCEDKKERNCRIWSSNCGKYEIMDVVCKKTCGVCTEESNDNEKSDDAQDNKRKIAYSG